MGTDNRWNNIWTIISRNTISYTTPLLPSPAKTELQFEKTELILIRTILYRDMWNQDMQIFRWMIQWSIVKQIHLPKDANLLYILRIYYFISTCLKKLALCGLIILLKFETFALPLHSNVHNTKTHYNMYKRHLTI